MGERENYLKEIRAHFNPALYSAMFLNPLTKSFIGASWGMFPEVSVKGIEHVHQASQKGTVVYLSNHRSYTDPCLIDLVLYREKLRKPFYATGKNMFNAWSGIFLKNLGAFSIDRQKRGHNYLGALKDYVKELLEQKHDFVFYLEGGRSYDGSLQKPKPFILKAILESEQKNVSIIPTALNYEQVLEDRVLTRTGKKTGQRSFTEEVAEMWNMFFQYYPARKGLDRRYRTKSYVSFAEPLNSSEYNASKAEDVDALAEKVMGGIRTGNQASATSIAAQIVLSESLQPFLNAGISEERIQEGLAYLLSREAIGLRNGSPVIRNQNLLEYYVKGIS